MLTTKPSGFESNMFIYPNAARLRGLDNNGIACRMWTCTSDPAAGH